MKIIFSRKGFDSRNGGVASPIFPDGRMRSLPIPDKNDKVSFKKVKCDLTDLGYRAKGLGSLVQDLTFRPRKNESSVKGTDTCHLDPDLIRSDLTHRKAGWLPMFGQGNAACAHLLNNGIREGDLFLFFGWFHRVQKSNGQFKFDPERQDVHVIFGWLQIGEIWCGFNANADIPKWARYHPHVHGDPYGLCNLKKPVDAVFISKRRLALPGLCARLPGGGVFTKYHKKLLLTAPEETRRVWRVPSWMYPFPSKPPLTYHPDRRRWRKVPRKILLTTVDTGQEFVLDTDYYPKAEEWLAELFRAAA